MHGYSSCLFFLVHLFLAWDTGHRTHSTWDTVIGHGVPPGEGPHSLGEFGLAVPLSEYPLYRPREKKGHGRDMGGTWEGHWMGTWDGDHAAGANRELGHVRIMRSGTGCSR